MGSEPHTRRRSPGGGWRQGSNYTGIITPYGLPSIWRSRVLGSSSMPLPMLGLGLQRGNQGPAVALDAQWMPIGGSPAGKLKELKLRVSAVASSGAQHPTSASMVAPGAAPRAACDSGRRHAPFWGRGT